MANPEHVPDLDGFDRATVSMYRLGVVAAPVALGGLAWLALRGHDTFPGHVAVLGATALAVANLHLYDKRIRWVIGASAWVGAALVATGGHWPGHAGLGFLFVALSAIALKERFCFRIPGLRLVPLLLAASLIPLLLGQGAVAALLLAPATLLYAALAIAKLRMPLHFDVGDKSRYQV
jgi:uncharacterized integral membrane protein